MISETDVAYLAGLIDGDGYIGIRKREKPSTIGDRARNAGFILLVKIGGETNHLNGLKEYWKIGAVWVRKKPGLRHLAEWTIAGKDAEHILTSLIPHLRLKKRQAQIAVEMPHPRTRWGVTQEIREKQEFSRIEIQRLNQLGRGKKEKII